MHAQKKTASCVTVCYVDLGVLRSGVVPDGVMLRPSSCDMWLDIGGYDGLVSVLRLDMSARMLCTGSEGRAGAEGLICALGRHS